MSPLGRSESQGPGGKDPRVTSQGQIKPQGNEGPSSGYFAGRRVRGGQASKPQSLSASSDPTRDRELGEKRNQFRNTLNDRFENGGLWTAGASDPEEAVAKKLGVKTAVEKLISEIPEDAYFFGAENILSTDFNAILNSPGATTHVKNVAKQTLKVFEEIGMLQSKLSLQKWGYQESESVLKDHGLMGNFTDMSLRPGSLKPLGSGAVNDVMIGTFYTPEGPKQMVLKKEKTFDKAKMADMQKALAVDPASPRTLQRNVGYYIVGKELGWDVVPRTEMAVVDGELYTAMELAPGVAGGAPGKSVEVHVSKDDSNYENMNDVYKLSFKEAKKDGVSQKVYIQNTFPNYSGLRPVFDNQGRTEPKNPEEKPVGFVYDIASVAPGAVEFVEGTVSPEVAANLERCEAQMSWLDSLFLQLDRHVNNFFIEWMTGLIKLIDNDGCMPGLKEGETPKSMAAWTVRGDPAGGWTTGSHAVLLPVEGKDRALHDLFRQKLTDEFLEKNFTPLMGKDVVRQLKVMRDLNIERMDLLDQHDGKLPGEEVNQLNSKLAALKAGLVQIQARYDKNVNNQT